MGIVEVFATKYTLIVLLVCLLVSVGLTVLYLTRMQKADKNDISAPAIMISTAHFLGYLGLTIVTGLGVFGAYFHKAKFLLWFSIGSLLVVIGESACLIWGLFVQDVKEKQPSILMITFTVFVIVLFVVSAVFTFILKRSLTKDSAVPVPSAAPPPSKVEIKK